MLYFEKKYLLTVDKRFIIPILADLTEYAKYHPLLVEARKLDGPELGFELTEKPYSWFPYTIKYQASVSASENRIEYQISEVPLHQIKIRYELSEIEKSKTEILFHLEINGPPVFRNILLRKMIKAQDELMLRAQQLAGNPNS